jgi:UDP:flavonoid glycosyltransferase YjiC (YdhE family)
VRALFSCVSAYGHFHPLLPLARALDDAGHEVAFAVAASFAPRVEAAGFSVLPAGIDQAERAARLAPVLEQLETLPFDQRRTLAFNGNFSRIDAPAKLEELRAAAGAWKPDLLVHDPCDLAGPIVAAELRIPSANHSFGRVIPLAVLERAEVETAPLWRAAGLEPDPFAGEFRGLYLDICPPSFQTGTFPAGARVQPLRPVFEPDPGDTLPDSVETLPERPTVYVTLGTVHNDLRVFRVLLAAIDGLECNAIVTIGRENDPSALEPLPENVVVERYIPQALLLPRCDAVVSHGGSGSLLATLAAGLPMLLVPQGADQFENAAHAAQIGAAKVLLPNELTEDAVRAAVAGLLEDQSYRESAARVAAEIAAMPPPEELVPVLVEIAA